MKHIIRLISITALFVMVLSPIGAVTSQSIAPQEGQEEKGKWVQSFSGVFEANYWEERSTIFKDYLYFTLTRANNTGEAVLLYRTADGMSWEPVIQPAFGNTILPGYYYRTSISLFEYKNKLYAGLQWEYYDYISFWDAPGGQIWRSEDGTTWEKVIDLAGQRNNLGFKDFAEFQGMLYAISFTFGEGFEVWRSMTGNADDWTRVAERTFGNVPYYGEDFSLYAFKDKLFAFPNRVFDMESWTWLPLHGWYTEDGLNWKVLTDDGFGDPRVNMCNEIEEFKGNLYVGTEMVDPETGNFIPVSFVSSNGTEWTVFCTDCFGYGAQYQGRMNFTWLNPGLMEYRSKDMRTWELVSLDRPVIPELNFPYFNVLDIGEFDLFKGDPYYLATDFSNNYQIWRWCQECK